MDLFKNEFFHFFYFIAKVTMSANVSFAGGCNYNCRKPDKRTNDINGRYPSVRNRSFIPTEQAWDF